ncbi:hypothetical protein MMC09_002155 [Bachmanniomyces sp. S44760]|nr:hypothetical protein [Bachmanniomyces sp. S44760]
MDILAEKHVIIHVRIAIPSDVLIYICEYLDFKDLKSIRLVCKELSAASEKRLFSKVVISNSLRDLRSLISVSKHPVRKYLKNLIFDPRMFSEKLASDWRLYWAQLKLAMGPVLVTELISSKAFLQQSFDDYHRLWSEQLKCQQSGDLKRTLSEALPLLPALHQTLIPSNGNRHLLPIAIKRGVIADSRTRGTIALPPLMAGIDGYWDKSEYDLLDTACQYHTIRDFLNSLICCIRPQMQAIVIDPMLQQSDVRFDRTHEALLGIMFRYMTSVKLCIGLHMGILQPRPLLEGQHFRLNQLFKNATQLKILDLDVHGYAWTSSRDPRPVFGKLKSR